MPKHRTSVSVDTYLTTILTTGSDAAKAIVPISSLAKKLFVQPVSVNQMVKKMEKKELVESQDKQVRLSTEMASAIIVA